MKASDDLFRIIKSLSPNEKRYFKLQASIHVLGEKNNYVRLFDAIDKQERYDEKQLKDFFLKEPFVGHFHLAKRYLTNLIKKSLLNYHANDSVSLKLNDNIKFIEILFHKGLYENCLRIIYESKKIAMRYEKYSLLLTLLFWETEVEPSRENSRMSPEDTARLRESAQSSFRSYLNETDYRLGLINGARVLNETGFARNKGDIQRYNKIRKNSLFRDESNALSFRSRYDFYQVQTVLSYMCNDYEMAYNYSEKLISHLSKHKYQFHEVPDIFVSAIHNLIYYHVHFRKFKVALEETNRLKSIKTRSEGLNRFILYWSHCFEIQIYYLTSEYGKALSVIKAIQPEFSKPYFGVLNEQNNGIIYANIFKIYFVMEKYPLALLYINKLLNEIKHIRKDVECILRIINLIVHYEMGKQDIIEYSVKSAYRFLYKSKRLYKFENIFLDFIKKDIPGINSKEQSQTAFKKLKRNLQAVLNDPYETNILKFFDFVSWLESKIENRPFVEIVKEKAKRF